MKHISFTICFGLVVSACSSTTLMKEEVSDIHSPEIGAQASAPLGDALYFRQFQIGRPAIKLSEEIVVKPLVGKLVISPQIAPLQKVKKGEAYYLVSGRNCSIVCDTVTLPFIVPVSGTPTSGKPYARIPGMAKFETPQSAPNYSNAIFTTLSDRSFRTEFIYNGVSGTTLKFVYREFINDLARPSFTQDVQYDLSKSKVVGFKGLEMEILEATNEKLVYKINKPMDTPIDIGAIYVRESAL